MLLGLKEFVQSHNIPMSRLIQNSDLLLRLYVVLEVRHIDRLNSYQLFGNYLHRYVHLPKGAFPDYFTHAVELHGRLGAFIRFLEGLADVVDQFAVKSFSWRDVRLHGLLSFDQPVGLAK